MRRRMTFAVAVILTACMLGGCGSTAVDDELFDEYKVDGSLSSSETVYLLVDNQTHVCYLETRFGLEVMRNPDGSPRIFDESMRRLVEKE